MFEFSLPKAGSVILLCVAFSSSVWAQYPPPPPAPTPSPAPAPAPTPTPAPTPGPTPTGTTGTTSATNPTATSTTTVSNIPGYTTPAGRYSPGKTIAYVVAPFAIVGGTYLVERHQRQGQSPEIELHPNAGFFWPRHIELGTTTAHMRDEGVYGLKAGVSVGDHAGIEGSFGYINHFESRLVPTRLDQSFGIQARSIFALLYDVNGVWNLSKREMFNARVTPYVTGGVGGLSTEVRDTTSALVAGELYRRDAATGTAVLNPTRTIVVADNSAFFSVNYGAGIKATNVWGPMGFRLDVRGRTFPNFRGEALTWPEATAGLTFTLGER